MQLTDGRNRRGYDAGGLSNIFKRTARVVPAFIVLALISCTLGYYMFHVPLNQLAVVVAVPCVVSLAMTRILALVIPRSAKESAIAASFQALVVLAVSAAFIAMDFLFSAAIYYGLGLRHVVIGALRIAEYGAATAFCLIILALFTQFPDLWTAVLAAALKLLRSQTRLTNAFLTPPWLKH